MMPFEPFGRPARRFFANHASMMKFLIGTPGMTGHRFMPPPDTAFGVPILPVAATSSGVAVPLLVAGSGVAGSGVAFGSSTASESPAVGGVAFGSASGESGAVVVSVAVVPSLGA